MSCGIKCVCFTAYGNVFMLKVIHRETVANLIGMESTKPMPNVCQFNVQKVLSIESIKSMPNFPSFLQLLKFCLLKGESMNFEHYFCLNTEIYE